MEYRIVKADELYHHGIKGQKWGIRRYQNKDGSLTKAGLKRRAKLESKLEKLGGKKKTADESENTQSAKKTASNMSDDELAKAITRARMEDEYRRLRPEPKTPEKGAFMKQMMNDVVKPAMINSGRKALESAMGQVVEKLTKGKVDPNSIEALKKTYEKLDYKQKIDKILNPDKYLSEEDKNKRQTRTFEAEDRAAKMEGYQNAADKAAQERTRTEAARKAAADEAAGRANVPRSEEYYNSRYNTKGGERTDVGSNSERGLSVYNQSSSSITNAKSVIKEFSTSSVTDLSRSSVDRGRDSVNEYSGQVLLDKDGRVIRRLDD